MKCLVLFSLRNNKINFRMPSALLGTFRVSIFYGTPFVGCASGSTFMAETMTKGRGRQGKVWTAPPRGNIYVTFVLRLPEKVR